MGNRPVNAIPGFQGFQPTGRKDPSGQPSGIVSRLMARLGFGPHVTPRDAAGTMSSTGFDSATTPGPPSHVLLKPGYDVAHQSYAQRKRVSEPQSAGDGQGDTTQHILTDAQRDEIWNETFYRARHYGAHRRFGIHDEKHDHIADMADLLKQEGNTPRWAGRPGIDESAHLRQGDLELQLRAVRTLPSAILDLDAPSHSRYEGLGVYAPDTVALAKEIKQGGERRYTEWSGIMQPDGTVKQVQVVSSKVWRLVRLVERDQAASTRLRRDEVRKSVEASASDRFRL